MILDLDDFIADCRAAVRAPRPAALIRELVARAVSRPADVERALGSPREGGLFPLHRSPELTIVNVVWTPGMAIYPHEHGGTPRSEWTPDTLEERAFHPAHARRVYALANARWRRETEAGP